MFETITLYDNRAKEATFTRTEDGRYSVRLAYQSRKLPSAGQGVETEVDHNDWIEIGRLKMVKSRPCSCTWKFTCMAAAPTRSGSIAKPVTRRKAKL